jgi:hypothetical protein
VGETLNNDDILSMYADLAWHVANEVLYPMNVLTPMITECEQDLVAISAIETFERFEHGRMPHLEYSYDIGELARFRNVDFLTMPWIDLVRLCANEARSLAATLEAASGNWWIVPVLERRADWNDPRIRLE